MTNPLFYNEISALNSEQHRKLKLKPVDKPFEFASQANLIPALAEEFAAALGQMPVAFLPGNKHPSAVFVTGTAPGTNLFVSDKGEWTGDYVPAYLRRYPFIMGDVPNASPVLCVDTSYSGLNEKTGEALFADDGEIGEPLQQALSFAENYRVSALATEAMIVRLQELELFTTVTLDAKGQDGQSSVIHGLMIVDEAALNALSPDVLGELRQRGFLRAIYAHLFSLADLARLARRARVGTASAA